jgi:glucokinase
VTDSSVVAVDVGGSSLKSGIVEVRSSHVTDRRVTPVDSGGSADTILSTLAGLVMDHLQVVAPAHVTGVALAFPGPFDYDEGISLITGLAKYESLYGCDVREGLRRRLDADVPIRFRNDAEAAILGESTHGAGQGYRRIIGITLGTGLGSAYVVDGHPVEDGAGVPPHGWLHPFDVDGARADDVFSTRGLHQSLVNEGLVNMNAATATRAARAGDHRAASVLTAFGTRLGEFLSPYVRDFGADAILVLGGISHAFDLFGPPLQQSLPVPVLKGRLERDAPLVGAAMLFVPQQQAS